MSWLHCSSIVVVLWLLLPAPQQAAGHNPPSTTPLLARLGKDPATSLYTISIKHGGLPLVVDIAGPLYWSRCPPAHRTIPCQSNVCHTLNRNLPPSTCTCTAAYINYTGPNCACPAYPYNPISGQCGITDATTFTLSAYGTDGANPLFPVTFMAVGACSTEPLFSDGSLPADSWGLAGMSRLPQSLPTQAASIFHVRKEFALCLPRSGAAIFGGGPFQFMAAPQVDLAADGLRQNQVPFLKYSQNGAYYLRVRMNVARVADARPAAVKARNANAGRHGKPANCRWR
jgi:hypothetical protein